MENIVYSSAIQSDGKIIIGGSFITYNGTGINYLARLNTNGTLDSSFIPGTGPSLTVRTISIQSDGKIIIGGDFTSYNGTTINRIARLNADGSLDTSFSPGTGANNNVRTVSVQSDGKIIIGGDFTNYSWSRNGIARLNANGSLDTSFNPWSWVAGWPAGVWNTATQYDGKIIISGVFTSYNGTTVNRIARLTSTGALDTTFNSGGAGTNNTINAMVMQSDGKIIIGGGVFRIQWYNENSDCSH